MNKSRRIFLKAVSLTLAYCSIGYSLFKSIPVFAARNNKAFSAESQYDALADFFPGENITPSDHVKIDAHDLIENGAVVPINIKTDLPDVTSITILVEKNPNPLIASFNLGPGSRAFIATRIKMATSSNVTAVVRSGNGLFSQVKFIEVVAGGCGS